jgi:ubiquinone/menaquinone biosynthesis C-methylase UbiE
MFKSKSDCVKEVQAVYSGPEGQLWELLMGEQIHVGGFASSADLAHYGGVKAGTKGVDFCCCSGAGMRFLIKFCGVSQMEGVDFTPAQIALGKKRMKAAGITAKQYRYHLGDVAAPKVAAGSFDFVWGEDAWCYVADKPGLLQQALRALKPGGKIVFSDWVATDKMTAAEAKRFITFMKFPSLMTVADYEKQLKKTGFSKIKSKVSCYFVPSMELYVTLCLRQKTYDVLRLLGFSKETFKAVLEEMGFIMELAKSKKIVQAYVVAQK